MLEVWLKFVATLLWPIVTLIVVLLFREDLRTFLEKIQRAKFGMVEFQTEQKVREVLAQAVDISAKSPVELINAASNSDVQHVQQDKYTVIVEIRNQLYNLVHSLAIDEGLVKRERISKAPLAWLLQRLRSTKPNLSQEFDTLSQFFAAAEEILKDPQVSEAAVRDLAGAGKLVYAAISENLKTTKEK